MQRLTVLLAISLCTPLLLLPASGQKKQQLDPFASVPEKLRASLVKRMSLLVEYQKNQRWDEMYNLLGEQFKMSAEGGLSKERWQKDHPRSRLTKFTPTSATLLSGTPEDGYWIIRGCGEFSRFGPNEKLESALEAYRQNEDWYFSDIGVEFPCIHCLPKGCHH